MASVSPIRRLVVSTWATVSRVQATPRRSISSARACWVKLALARSAAMLRRTMSSMPMPPSPFMASPYRRPVSLPRVYVRILNTTHRLCVYSTPLTWEFTTDGGKGVE